MFKYYKKIGKNGTPIEINIREFFDIRPFRNDAFVGLNEINDSSKEHPIKIRNMYFWIEYEADKVMDGYRFLLTYYLRYVSSNTNHTFFYEWFETEDELRKFVEDKKKEYKDYFVISDCMEILNAREVKI